MMTAPPPRAWAPSGCSWALVLGWGVVPAPQLARPVPPGPSQTCPYLLLSPPRTQALAVLCAGILCPRPEGLSLAAPEPWFCGVRGVGEMRLERQREPAPRVWVHGTPCWCL